MNNEGNLIIISIYEELIKSINIYYYDLMLSGTPYLTNILTIVTIFVILCIFPISCERPLLHNFLSPP